MSEINHASLCYPPQFPELGRLPRRASPIYQNLDRQRQLENDYQDAMAVATGRRGMPPCCKTLHVSLFFDGTGNNLNNDLYESGGRPHPTNIARLFRATIGAGHAGGTAHGTSQARRLTDDPGTGTGKYFKYYIPGVGTPFPEVGDMDYSNFGLAFAGYGEERINWGLLMIIDALRRSLGLPRLDNTTLHVAVLNMGTSHGMGWLTGYGNRADEFRKQLDELIIPLRQALTTRPGQCKLLGLKLYVYGFSRGAAAARAFVSWLNQLLTIFDSAPGLQILDKTLPISVEYLGLLDTVASVGLANLLPGPEGHMSWADGTQELPKGELVKRCLHIVASHEQRLCFPLDSIRRKDGSYPANSVEVLHPGVHSDQGGGYPPGDQGKARSEDPRVGDGLLLSQIALNDLYADAFAHGAPLKVPPKSLPIELSEELWRAMEFDVEQAFDVAPTLVNRFNAWRHATLSQLNLPQPLSIEQSERYQPVPASESLEAALREQMAWITAWRIDRYAFATLKEQEFYKQASDTQADEAVRKRDEAVRDKLQADIEKRRAKQREREHFKPKSRTPLEPGFKDFDPDMAQTQLREAAEEFAVDYRTGLPSPVLVSTLVFSPLAPPVAQLTAETRAERERMITAGRARVSQLFPPPRGGLNHIDEHRRGTVNEWINEDEPSGLLRALFDDQVHDSRAWFLYATLINLPPMYRRELFGSYLRERMVFFGDTNSRKLAVYDQNNQLIAAGDPRWSGLEQLLPTQPAPMTKERFAQGQQAIAARWDAYYAQTSEVNDEPV